MIEDPSLQPYYVNMNVECNGQPVIIDRPLRLDMLYEQIQTILDNTVRQMANKLSLAMREQRKANNPNK